MRLGHEPDHSHLVTSSRMSGAMPLLLFMSLWRAPGQFCRLILRNTLRMLQFEERELKPDSWLRAG